MVPLRAREFAWLSTYLQMRCPDASNAVRREFERVREMLRRLIG